MSCGCFADEAASARFTKHGESGTPEYLAWNSMLDRCLNPRSSNFPNYGGRGISVCDEWRGSPDGLFRFLAYLGPRPDGHSLDRIDVNGNYEPGNVRWADKEVQANNRRVTVYITANGITLPQAEWTRRTGLGKNTIAERIKKGWPADLAATTSAGEEP